MKRRKGCIYVRFSSDMQHEESIGAQVRACQEFAERNNIEMMKFGKFTRKMH